MISKKFIRFIVISGIAVGALSACVILSVELFYDGGIACFGSPKDCNLNARPSILPTRIPTVIPITRTLASTPTQFNPPTPTIVTPVATLLSEIREQDPDVSCGRNPYKQDSVKGHWERGFNTWCFKVSHDPFDMVFWGFDYGQVSTYMEILGASSLSHDEQVARLIDVGLWDVSCNCVPDSPVTLETVTVVETATPTPFTKKD